MSLTTHFIKQQQAAARISEKWWARVRELPVVKEGRVKMSTLIHNDTILVDGKEEDLQELEKESLRVLKDVYKKEVRKDEDDEGRTA